MNSGRLNVRFTILAGLILLAAFSRCIPHMMNFSPVAAMGLFGAAYFQKKWQAFLIPLVATWLSDLFINNVIYAKYNPHFTWFYSGFHWIYGAYVLIILAGIFLLKRITPARVLVASLVASGVFFVVTNFICWPGNALYTQDVKGLMTCFAAGLPFLKGTLLGDLFFSGVLFGGFAILQRSYPVLRTSRAV